MEELSKKMLLVAFFLLSFNFLLGFELNDHIYSIMNIMDAMEDEEDASARLLQQMNEELLSLNQASAALEWSAATSPSIEISRQSTKISRLKTVWRNDWCSRGKMLRVRPVEKKMLRLLCRGPKYTPHQAKALTNIFEKLSSSYTSSRVCRIEPQNNEQKCFSGEPDLERLMATSRNETELRWAWISWRDEMSKARGLFSAAVTLQNLGARNNGYHDIGECWREELESPDLEDLVDELYRDVEPLYKLLHAVVRFRLAKKYPNVVDPRGPIPAHLLGNMWAQNWESLVELLLPISTSIVNVTNALRSKNYTVKDMVKRAEDFYVSLGLPPMTKQFWQKSVFEKGNNTELSCHGTAANMFRDGDYRMLACAEVSAEDFYVVHHEMGHIQYYMAYRDQPAIFMDGANSAFHEAIGDSVMYGVMTPQHMQRLGLIEDSVLNDDLPFVLRQALGKLPQMPHGLVMDKWRWGVFSGDIKPQEYNRAWWALSKRYQGIAPPVQRSEDFFDPAAKFHITDNTPYIRYFLGYILQVQLFKGMCEAAVTGKVGDPSFDLPLHRCDIYGSKDAGKRLRSLMKLGSSVDWEYALKKATGSPRYQVEPLLQYYQPLYKWLKLQIAYYNIPVGWN